VAHSLLSYARTYVIQTGATSSAARDVYRNCALSCLRLIPVLDIAFKFKEGFLAAHANQTIAVKEALIVKKFSAYLDSGAISSTKVECASIVTYYTEFEPEDKDILLFKQFLK
jgi:hypothetical protein